MLICLGVCTFRTVCGHIYIDFQGVTPRIFLFIRVCDIQGYGFNIFNTVGIIPFRDKLTLTRGRHVEVQVRIKGRAVWKSIFFTSLLLNSSRMAAFMIYFPGEYFLYLSSYDVFVK